MFTGIVEAVGVVEKIERKDTNVNFTIHAPFIKELKIDQSVAHNGCCLTVVDILEESYVLNAIQETLDKTNLGEWKVGTKVNLERCVKVGERLDGHMVQGHIDKTGEIIAIEDKGGSYIVTVNYQDDGIFITVPQGSIALNGISLTVARSEKGCFSVAIIPYTWEHTNMKDLKVGDKVNLEFDIIGKYIAKLLSKQNAI